MPDPSQPDPLAEVARMIADLRKDLQAEMDAKLERSRDEMRDEIANGLAYMRGDPPAAVGADPPPDPPPAAHCHRRGRFWVIPTFAALAAAAAWLRSHRAGAMGWLVAAPVAAVMCLSVTDAVQHRPIAPPSYGPVVPTPGNHETYGQQTRRAAVETPRPARSPDANVSAQRDDADDVDVADVDDAAEPGTAPSPSPTHSRRHLVRKVVSPLLPSRDSSTSRTDSDSRSEPSTSSQPCMSLDVPRLVSIDPGC